MWCCGTLSRGQSYNDYPVNKCVHLNDITVYGIRPEGIVHIFLRCKVTVLMIKNCDSNALCWAAPQPIFGGTVVSLGTFPPPVCVPRVGLPGRAICECDHHQCNWLLIWPFYWVCSPEYQSKYCSLNVTSRGYRYPSLASPAHLGRY